MTGTDEVLGHGLQSASLSAEASSHDAPHQVMLEGLAQAFPLFILPDDKILSTFPRLSPQGLEKLLRRS